MDRFCRDNPRLGSELNVNGQYVLSPEFRISVFQRFVSVFDGPFNAISTNNMVRTLNRSWSSNKNSIRQVSSGT